MWSAAYPFGAYGLTCSQLAIDLDSSTFRVITAIILVVLVSYWLYLVVFTLPLIVSGKLFLEEAYHEQEEEKEREQTARSSRIESYSPA